MLGLAGQTREMVYLYGKVVDARDQSSLPGAVVSVQGTDLKTITDVNSEFKDWELPAGEHILIVSYLGYQTKERPIFITAGQRATIIIKLIASTNILNVVTVVGSRSAPPQCDQLSRSYR